MSMYEPIYNDGADALFIVDQIGDDKNIDDIYDEPTLNIEREFTKE